MSPSPFIDNHLGGDESLLIMDDHQQATRKDQPCS